MATMTTEGLSIDRLADIKSQLEDAFRTGFGSTINLSEDNPLGIIIGIISEREALLQELIQQNYDAFDPTKSEGVQLDNILDLVGLTRNAATFSVGVVTCSGTNGTIIPKGSVVRVSSTDARFETVLEVTIPAAGSIDVSVQALVSGAVAAPASMLNDIVTSISGWDSVTNALDITIGRDEESDADARTRRNASLAVVGGSTDQAIKAKLLELEEITTALVVSNRTLIDVDGQPGKSFQPVIFPQILDADVQEEIANIIYENAPAGIKSFGSDVTFTVTDSQGYPQNFSWSWATEIDIYVECDLTTNDKFPANGATQVQDIIVATGDDFGVGGDIIILQLISAIFNGVPGIVDIALRVDTITPAVNTANLAIGTTEVSQFDTSRTTVTIL